MGVQTGGHFKGAGVAQPNCQKNVIQEVGESPPECLSATLVLLSEKQSTMNCFSEFIADIRAHSDRQLVLVLLVDACVHLGAVCRKSTKVEARAAAA